MKIETVVSRYAIFVALLIECAILSAATDSFLTTGNISNVLRQNAFTAILAAGMTFVILIGGIDLSVGSVVAFSGIVCATLVSNGLSMASAVSAGLLAGLAAGLLNGALVTGIGVPAFIVTLATMQIVRGAAYKYTNARTITDLPESFASLSGTATTAIIMLAIFLASWILLNRTAFGRHVYAIGGNKEAALLSGVRVRRVQLIVYSLCGLFAGLSGILVASRLNAGYPRAGEFYELDAIAAVVVGGTSLFGGRGSIWGTLAGAFFIGVLNNGLNLFRISPYDQLIVKGVILLTAASLDRWRGADVA
jgi:ribose/xylose/arabinose/galactoside ABC-type transport system permease subunit